MAIKNRGSGRPDHTRIITGDQGISVPQDGSSGKPIYRKGGSEAECDVDIGTSSSPVNIGSNGSDFESGPRLTGGAAELSMTIVSDSNADFDVQIDWLDQDNNVLRSETPASLQAVQDIESATIISKSDRFELKVTDASASATNNIHGTANAH